MRRNSNFKRRICDIVWTDSIEPHEFEEKWGEIMKDFKLDSNKWLSDMYEIRGDWIPAYYRHEHMSGLMRTTSRSESENHFFGQLTNSSFTLVEFLSNFDTAMESQKYNHRKNDHDTRDTIPRWETKYEIERQANEIYTRNIFYDVQKEICHGVDNCISRSVEEVGDFYKFSIRDKTMEGSGLYEVCLDVFHNILLTILQLSYN